MPRAHNIYIGSLGGSVVSLSDFLSGIFLPLTSAEACKRSSWWLLKENMC